MAKQVATAPQQGQEQSRNLYVTVNTYDKSNKQIGTRIVDMYHYGTRNWLQNHHWWAMHNGHTVETTITSEVEVDQYLADVKNKLADKFNNEPAQQAAVA